MRTGMRRFVRDVGFSFVSLGISAVVHFALRVFLARYLGESDLGLYTLSFTVYSFGILFGAFGIGNALTKYVAEFREDAPRTSMLLTNGIMASFAIGCIMGLLLYVGASTIANRFFDMPELAALLRIVSIAFPFIAIEKATLGFLNGLRRMRLFAIINISQNMLIVALTVLLVLSGHGLKGAAWALVLPVVVLSLFSVFIMRDSASRPRLSPFVTASKLLLAFGGFVVLANGIGMIQTNMDSVMIGYFMKDADVGIYAAAVVLSQAILLPSQALQMITGPMMATLWGKGDRAGIEKVINDTLKFTAAFIIPIAFTAIILAPDLLKVIFTEKFVSATDPLRILLIGIGFLAIWASVGAALSSTAYVKVIFILGSVSLAANMLLNALLIPRLGISGAATATSSAAALGALLQLYFTQRLVGIRIQWKWLFAISLFTGLLGGGCYALAHLISPYACLSIFLVLFGAVFLRFFLGKEHLESVKRLVRRGHDA
jgi:O-antigen/teichoic acid export membrane protein